MNFLRTSAILGLALLASAPIASAQLISRTFDVTGANLGVVARFTIWIDATNNTYVVDINNALPAANSAQVGTITGFGFNTPFTIASQTNDNPGTVAVKSKWTQLNPGHTGMPTTLGNNDDFWNEETPYSLNPIFSQDYGVTAPNPNLGIEYGEKATFVFTFTQDITAANLAGFLNNNASTTNKFDFSVRWQEVDTKYNYICNGYNGCDSDKGGIDLIGFSDGELPPVPEPSTYGLMGAAALAGLIAHRRRQAKKNSQA